MTTKTLLNKNLKNQRANNLFLSGLFLSATRISYFIYTLILKQNKKSKRRRI